MDETHQSHELPAATTIPVASHRRPPIHPRIQGNEDWVASRAHCKSSPPSTRHCLSHRQGATAGALNARQHSPVHHGPPRATLQPKTTHAHTSRITSRCTAHHVHHAQHPHRHHTHAHHPIYSKQAPRHSHSSTTSTSTLYRTSTSSRLQVPTRIHTVRVPVNPS